MLLWTSLSFGQDAPVPVDEEPHHHVLFKNEWVIVIRATLQSGESTLYNTHSHDMADIDLLGSTTSDHVFGKQEGQAETSLPGTVSADSVSAPITHRVRNVDSGPMDIFHVELLQRPAHPIAQAGAQVAAENASARVYNWILAPGVTSPTHTHQRPYLIVARTGMRLKMTSPDGPLLSEQVKPGDFRWVEAKVTHALSNQGNAEGQIVEIELK